MGLFDRAKQSFGIDQVQDFLARGEYWGRIVSIESRVGPRIVLQVEIHTEEQPVEVHRVTEMVPRGIDPEVGMDVAIVDRTGPGASVTTYKIKWDKEPQYGVPDPTQDQIQDAVLPPTGDEQVPAPGAKPPALEQIERMRDAGSVSEEDFQRMRENIMRPLEQLERMRESGAITEEAYQRQRTMEARVAGAQAAGGSPMAGIPTAQDAMASVSRTLDSSVELELIREGTSAKAVVLELPSAVEGDRFSLQMPLEVRREDEPAYRVDCVFPAARPITGLQVGTELPVKVDAEDRSRVAVVWNLWKNDAGAAG